MALACHAVVVRSHSVESALPWPHWRGALPSEEQRPDFAPPADPTHPFRAGEFYRELRLHGDQDALELGTVMAAICLYNDAADGDDDAPVTDTLSLFQRLLEREALIVAGGLQLHLDDHLILSPQCCCGLETWREWLTFADGGDPPWCGHSPDPHLERRPDGHLELGYPDATHRIDPADLRAALADAARDLAAFAERLTAWLTELAPTLGPALAEKLALDLALR